MQLKQKAKPFVIEGLYSNSSYIAVLIKCSYLGNSVAFCCAHLVMLVKNALEEEVGIVVQLCGAVWGYF